jgi:hypothetical protein
MIRQIDLYNLDWQATLTEVAEKVNEIICVLNDMARADNKQSAPLRDICNRCLRGCKVCDIMKCDTFLQK